MIGRLNLLLLCTVSADVTTRHQNPTTEPFSAVGFIMGLFDAEQPDLKVG